MRRATQVVLQRTGAYMDVEMPQYDTELTARIPVLPETRDKLKDMKEDGERYEDVLQDFIELAEKRGTA